MQRLVFEYSPAFIILCVALGIGYAWLLYRRKNTWGTTVNRLLFIVRTTSVALAAFLLIGPILKLTTNQLEKPSIVYLVDNSGSVAEVLGKEKRDALVEKINAKSAGVANNGYEVVVRGLNGKVDSTERTSDLHGAILTITADYEGKNLAGIVLVSDGIYNSGPSPLYTPLRIPVYTVGIGDTTQRVDLALKNIAFNKIAYQGNRFPVRAEVLVRGLENTDVKVSVSQGGKLLTSQNKNSGTKGLIDFDFLIDANEKGIQRLDVVVEPVKAETNQRNNRSAIYVEIVEGKKKILVVAPSPHPDIKALRAAIERNSNYEFHLHMPGVKEVEAGLLEPDKIDLVVFSQVFDNDGKTFSLFQKFQKSKTGMFLMVGAKTNLRQFASAGIPITFENIGQKDEVIPSFNTQFRDFAFSDDLAGRFARYPPATTPFGKFTYPGDAAVLLFQRIGSVTTNRPLLLSFSNAGSQNRIAVLLGEGIWKWRLNEFAETEKSDAFDEVFSRLIQYLSTQEDKRKFRSFPIQNEFSDSEPVTFESQLYNELFEQIYGNTVQIELRDESGKATQYSYTTSPSGSRYRIGGLKEGIYKYTASTQLTTGTERVSGEFLVTAQNIESQNLTADFGLLRKLSSETGGKFYTEATADNIAADITKLQAKTLIHSEDSFHPMINLKAVFFVLLFLLSLEWFARKFYGSY